MQVSAAYGQSGDTPNGLRAWTEEQLRAIERRGGDLLLDAGAGSGKTSVLVERFTRAVVVDELDVSAILAITFTDKAAAELRERIRARLRELGAADQAEATEGAFISTIHGFCARVLRAEALTAGLDPGFVVLDRDRSDALAGAAFDDALQDLSSSDGTVQLIADYGAGRLRGAILDVYSQLRSRGQPAPRLPALEADAARTAAAATAFQSAALEVAGELRAIPEPSVRVLEALARLQRVPELVAVADLWPGELDRARLGGNGAALQSDACVAYGEALAAYRAALAAQAAAPVRDHLDVLLRAFGERYAERKRAVWGVDFEDLELLTLELLSTNGGLRDRYAQRFEQIMVDELQDTNRVQLALIESIAHGNLFTVGDAQQSIYRFRHADVDLFAARGERLERSGGRMSVATNFRSRPEILTAINQAFAVALGDRFTPLLAGRTDPGGNVELLLVDKGAEWELEGLASPWRLAEARALADRVAECAAAGTAPGDIVVLTRATTDMRAYERALERRGLPTYLIGGRGYWLHPQVLDLVAYLRALANPLDEQALYTVLSSPMVGASFDALVVLAGAAREQGRDPWTVLADEQLDVLADSDRRALAQFHAWFGDERLSAFSSGLESLIDRALTRTGYDLAMLAMPGGPRRLANVRKLMRLAREFERDHGPDLRGFTSQIEDRQAGRVADSRESEAPLEGEGLDAVRLMTIHRAKGLEFDTVCVADLGRSARPPYEIVRVGADGRLGLRLARCGAGTRVSALDYEALGAEEKEAEEQEERRLFYVAMTRARERLILSGATRFQGWADGKWTGGGPVAWIAPAFVPELGRRIAEGGGIVELGGAQVRLTVAVPNGDAGKPPAAPAAPETAPPVPAASPGAPQIAPASPEAPAPPPAEPAAPVGTLSYSALAAYGRCGYRFYCERVLRLPGDAGHGTAGAWLAGYERTGDERTGDRLTGDRLAGGRSAVDRGLLLHALLQRVSFRRPVAPSADLIATVAAGAGLARPSSDEASELAATVARFCDSELCRRLAAAREVRREEQFAFELCRGVLVTGAVDVLARERAGRTLIVDYKSDSLEGADPAQLVADAYAIQRLLYALAALRAGAGSVEVAHCFLARPERPVIATLHRSAIGELEQRLLALARGVLDGEFPVSPQPHRALCAGCPAEGGLCSWPLQMTRRESADRLEEGFS